MISESYAWKDQLLSDADILERWAAKASVTERRSILIERKIFLAAYAIRKLREAGKLSSAFDDRTVSCQAFQSASDLITKENCHKFDELYDFDNPIRKTVQSMRLVDIIIHSFVFIECLQDDRSIGAFLVTSDRKRYDYLLMVDLDKFINLIRDVGEDYPSHSQKVFDEELNDWVVWQGHGDPPQHMVQKLDAARKRTGARRAKSSGCEDRSFQDNR